MLAICRPLWRPTSVSESCTCRQCAARRSTRAEVGVKASGRWFSSMPGSSTVILRGPQNPSGLNSCRQIGIAIAVHAPHINDGRQLATLRPALLARLGRVDAVVVDGERGTDKVGPVVRQRHTVRAAADLSLAKYDSPLEKSFSSIEMA